MAFNAGGANVGGVQSIEAGSLVVASTTTSITADNTYDIDFTVPAGKKFILKAWNFYKSSGTYTAGTIRLQIHDGTNVISVSSTATSLLGGTVLCLGEGQSIRCQVVVTGWSVTGNFLSQVLYQSVDI